MCIRDSRVHQGLVPDRITQFIELGFDRGIVRPIRTKLSLEHVVFDPEPRSVARGAHTNHALLWIEGQFYLPDYGVPADRDRSLADLGPPVDEAKSEHDLDDLSSLLQLVVEPEELRIGFLDCVATTMIFRPGFPFRAESLIRVHDLSLIHISEPT